MDRARAHAVAPRRVAAEPERLDDDDAPPSLRRLQYALHLASEQAYGLAPPPARATAHAELADALACARDATAEVAEAVSIWGAEGVEPLLHEWRGALFRVRLARLGSRRPPPPAIASSRTDRDGIAPAARSRSCSRSSAPSRSSPARRSAPGRVWAAGMVAVCGSCLAYRP